MSEVGSTLASARRTTLDTMQRGVGDEAGRASTDVRRLATPTGVGRLPSGSREEVVLVALPGKGSPRAPCWPPPSMPVGGRGGLARVACGRRMNERTSSSSGFSVFGVSLERLSFLMARSRGSPGPTVSPRYRGPSGTPACSTSRTISFRRTRRRSYPGACLITSPLDRVLGEVDKSIGSAMEVGGCED